MRRVGTLIAVLAVWLLPIPAQASPAAQAAIVLAPAVGPPTTVTTVRGSGFLPQERVIVDLDGFPAAQVRADRDGGLRARVVVPGSALPGEHPVSATGQRSGSTAEATFLVRTDWAEFRKNDARTGYNPFENVLGPSNVSGLTVAWKAKLAGSIMASTSVVGGVVYAVAGHLYAFDAMTGAPMWRTRSLVVSSPAVADGMVYVGANDGRLCAFDAATGHLVWAKKTGGAILEAPVVVGDVVYAGSSGDERLYAFDAKTGRKIWWRPNGSFPSSPAFADGLVYSSTYDGTIQAFEASTGNNVWEVSLAGPGTTPAVADGVVYVGAFAHTLYALDAATGSEIWRVDTGNAMRTPPAVANGVVYAAPNTNRLVAFDASTGSRLWTARTGSLIGSSPAVANGVVYVPSDFDGTLHAFDASSGAELWSMSTSDFMTASPAVVNGIVYEGGWDHYLYAFALPSGSRGA